MHSTHLTTKRELSQQLQRLGLSSGDIVNVKCSMKSLGPVEGGARTVIEALLEVVGKTGTIVADAFVRSYPLPLSCANKVKISSQSTPTYAGALARAMCAHPLASRSSHPIQKFVAIGAEAKMLTEQHTIGSQPYALLNFISEAGARNLKLGDAHKVPGVGTTHVAIELAGLREKHFPTLGTNYQDESGQVRLYQVEWPRACNTAWHVFYPMYCSAGAVISRGHIGAAPALLTDMAGTLRVELQCIKKDPRILLCKRRHCEACRLSWPFSDGHALSVLFWKSVERIRRACLELVQK